MSAADRIASGVAKHLFEFRPPTASMRDVTENRFSAGMSSIDQSNRRPLAPTSLQARQTQEARHGPS